ncbi:unnamed protein product [Dicrocoelium dendriticum]|nr:unnamed protein product [Dicrocoelium dendriticum]
MRKISTGSKIRRRGRMARSRAMILAWARKQKQKNLCHPVSIPLRVPLVCPLIGCNGTGHVNGIDLAHVTLSGCPNYHNLPFEKWAEMRAREDGFVSPVQLHSRDPSPIGSPNKTAKCVHSVERSHQFRTLMKEPSLDELATPVEIYQFRCSQQRLLVDKEHEAKEHLILCARIASLRSTASGNRGLDGSRTQPYKSSHNHKSHSVEHTGAALKQRISSVIFGDWQIEPTYLSDYPPDIACLPTIYVCEYCLAPMPFSITYERHRNECTWRSPPGKLIYQKDKLIFYEVDGEQDPDYCRNLCLLTKLFLKHKTVHELDQVPSFLFYILTETDADGSHILGYFSKQKPEDSHDTSSSTTVSYNNLSCILILPPYQCHGYGRMLIELSYTLSLMENRIGTPERPLSDPGLILYPCRMTIVGYERLPNARNVANTTRPVPIALPNSSTQSSFKTMSI